ncbi:MAG: (Fe-S)-binding protein [Promethearchaeota archaeon]
MNTITEISKKTKQGESEQVEREILPDLKDLLKRCYQCGRCSGVCQLSKVEKFTPSKIIQLILEGFEEKVLNSGILWDCLTCNHCLQNCPQNINFADVVRIARYKMSKLKKQNVDDYIAHKGMYTTISEIMSKSNIQPKRNLDWIPKNVKVSHEKGDILYYVGCLPYFNYEFENINPIAENTLKLISKIENKEILVFKDEICCGHDIYWGQGKIDEFINLAKKNIKKFDDAKISTIITACAECYRTFLVDYPKIFNNFKERFEVKHIIEYIYDNWKNNKIKFKIPKKSKQVHFTFHDPCRLSRFLPKDNMILEESREIFNFLKKLGYNFKEMTHNKENSLCCGVSSWMNCNEKSKALRYKRMLEAKDAGEVMVTSCPKCRIHFQCLQNDYENIASIQILDFSEFLVDLVEPINPNTKNGG